MPAPFTPVHIPFVSGLRQDLGTLAAESPSQLQALDNVVFTRKGHIKARPGIRSRDAQVQETGFGGGLTANLATAAGTLVPAGIVSTPYGSSEGSESPLLAYQGGSFFRKDGIWVKAGVQWSMRQTRSTTVRVYDPTGASMFNPVPVGQTLVGASSAIGHSIGFPILNTAGEIQSVAQGSIAGITFSEGNVAIGGDALFFIDLATGNVHAFIPGPLPAQTRVTIGAGADVSVDKVQNISGVLAVDGFYYVAFKSATAGRITVVRLNAAGGVTQTLNLNGLGTVDALSMSHSGTNRLGIVWRDTAAGGSVKTKILTVTAGTMADAAIDLTLTGVPLTILGLDFGKVHAGVTHDGKMSVLFNRNNGGLYVGGRLFTAATETAVQVLPGLYDAAGGQEWDPLFAGVVVGGRTLVGVMRSFNLFNSSSQWIVIDVTDLYASGTFLTHQVVAAGAHLGAARICPSSVYSTSTSVAFAVPEGSLFKASLSASGVTEVQRASIKRITLDLQPVQASHAHGNTLLSGQLLYTFDGSRVRPHHFVEETPHIFATSAQSAGGTLAAGSYSYQTTWEVVNARGQVMRSGASNIFTVPAVVLNNKVTIVTSVPQLWGYISQESYVRVRLWATVVNPTPGADKFFVTETSIITSGTLTASLVHSAPVSIAAEALYEGAAVFADMRAPGGDRGVAFANERAWCADDRRVYASKLLRPNIAPSWNTEGLHTIELPTALGTIQGLAGMGDRLVVVCSSGVAVVSGNGVDDNGEGVGWTTDTIDGAPGSGIIGPRGVVAIPQGVAFTGTDGDIWLVQPDYSVVPVSRPARLGSWHTNTDLAYVRSRLDSNGVSTNPVLLATGNSVVNWRVLDLEAGQWCNYVFDISPEPRYFAGVNGIPWSQVLISPNVYSMDDAPGLDFGDPANCHIRTGALRPADPAVRGWGRVRGLSIVMIPKGVSTVVQVRMYGDSDERLMMDKTQAYLPLVNTRWPDDAPEFRATQQRAGFVTVDLNTSGVDFEWKGLDLWVANSGETQPSRTRS